MVNEEAGDFFDAGYVGKRMCQTEGDGYSIHIGISGLFGQQSRHFDKFGLTPRGRHNAGFSVEILIARPTRMVGEVMLLPGVQEGQQLLRRREKVKVIALT